MEVPWCVAQFPGMDDQIEYVAFNRETRKVRQAKNRRQAASLAKRLNKKAAQAIAKKNLAQAEKAALRLAKQNDKREHAPAIKLIRSGMYGMIGVHGDRLDDNGDSRGEKLQELYFECDDIVHNGFLNLVPVAREDAIAGEIAAGCLKALEILGAVPVRPTRRSRGPEYVQASRRRRRLWRTMFRRALPHARRIVREQEKSRGESAPGLGDMTELENAVPANA